jgi:endonuclease YncB( thermonuclease family)
MVRSGMALAFLPQSDMYVEAEAEARDAGRGIWQPGIRFTLPWEWRVMNGRPIFGP